jgi:MATE family multidrug resistance protein
MRRSSINEDLLRRRYSSSSIDGGFRLSSALESLSLLDIDPILDDINDYSISNSGSGNGNIVKGVGRAYGAIVEDDDDYDENENDGLVASLALKAKVMHEAHILKDELRAMVGLAFPVIMTYMLELVPSIITLVLVGRMDNNRDDNNNLNDGGDEGIYDDIAKLHIDAAALGVMFYNIIGMSTGLGLLTALDTLCASAHGANRPHKMGTYLLTGTFVMSVLFVVVFVILCNASSVLLYFHQPPEVARNAGIFVLWMLPGLPFLYGYELLRKVSQARNETLPMISSAVVCVIVNLCSGYYMVNYTTLGWLGAALARTLGNVSMLPTIYLGMYYTDREFVLVHVRSGFRVEDAINRRAIFRFLNLGIPGMLQVMFEWVAFEILALECGILPDVNAAMIAIGSNAIAMQISTFLYMLYLGASVAGNIRIGNALGAGDVHRARMAMYLALGLGVLLSLANTIFTLSCRLALPSFFTSDPDLIGKTTDLLRVVAIFQIPDAINGVEQGIFRAIGKQSLAARLNAVAYYVVGIPLGYYLGLHVGYGIEGLWFGLVAGLTWGSTINTIILLNLDWTQLSLDARKRLSVVCSPPVD